ncbi:BlaI/MecI/CopY family transcriptional regulator [Arthrobacter russicus]|uniref:Transcriptional regulator n=1 Tax=Arthrobacter russicus TaxID=172040 RepID=A0ABU1JA36_9MICC|nr:BlaI/MecI/CopY family transcriptional regulator [Arthrobacter russicus]MDN5668488.1 BlaI/MecI/CopY family transcriptional regulator [Renibacterium salmoninarum]MDR6268262.1 putative transcriptional regulator [Arthrobacter russicus]
MTDKSMSDKSMSDRGAGKMRRNRGELETRVMRILWNAGRPLAAREVLDQFPQDEAVPALTTMLTVLDRLGKKGAVLKSPARAGGSVFAAAVSESESTAEAMVSALVSSNDRSAALLSFAGELDERDIEILRRVLRPDS